MLLRWLVRKLGNYHDAEDILQSCYARVISFSEKSAIDNPKALIFRTAANLTIDELRKRKRQRATIIESSPDDEREMVSKIACDKPNAETALGHREEIRQAIASLDRFSPNVKTAFLLNRVHGKTYSEIAQILGVSVSAVEKYMIRALKELRAFKEAQRNASETITNPKAQSTPENLRKTGGKVLAIGGKHE